MMVHAYNADVTILAMFDIHIFWHDDFAFIAHDIVIYIVLFDIINP